MTRGNPHKYPESWQYLAWEEGFRSRDDEGNPYLEFSEPLADSWQDGREFGIFERAQLRAKKEALV